MGNLLTNAERFNQEGGRIEVVMDADPETKTANVKVANSGVGMDAAMLSRLFAPFQQAEQDLARSKGGLGLGLALTKGLAELHGGTITAQSEGFGRGAVFTVKLPLALSNDLNAGRGARKADHEDTSASGHVNLKAFWRRFATAA